MRHPSFRMKHGVLAVLLGALAGSACAETANQAEGPYLGLGIGALHAKDVKAGELDPALQTQGLTVRTMSVEDHDTGWKL